MRQAFPKVNHLFISVSHYADLELLANILQDDRACHLLHKDPASQVFLHAVTPRQRSLHDSKHLHKNLDKTPTGATRGQRDTTDFAKYGKVKVLRVKEKVAHREC